MVDHRASLIVEPTQKKRNSFNSKVLYFNGSKSHASDTFTENYFIKEFNSHRGSREAKKLGYRKPTIVSPPSNFGEHYNIKNTKELNPTVYITAR